MTIFLPHPPALFERDGSQWHLRDGGTGSSLSVIEVVRVDRTSWRVSDPSLNPNDPCRLLGYVERLERDRFEVLWLTAPVEWAYVASFDLALAAVADREQFAGRAQPRRDPLIEPAPTPVFHRVHPRHSR